MGPFTALNPKFRHLRSAIGASLLLAPIATLLWACLQAPLSLKSGPLDGGSDGSATITEGGAPAILGLFTISGCRELTFLPPQGDPHCTGTAPLHVRLVLLAVGATTHRFQVTRADSAVDGGTQVGDGGEAPDAGPLPIFNDEEGRADAPELFLSNPGTYLVSLGVAGLGGTAAAAGVIIVEPAELGAACELDSQCAAGLRCLCGRHSRDGTCPDGLSAGLCTRSCDGTACPNGSACLDLSRSAAPLLPDGGPDPDTWRQPICVPVCTNDASCRADLLCRELPLLNASEYAGGAYTWGRACFARVPGGVGDSCIRGDEQPDPSACAFGICDRLGLRDLCTAPCETSCPASAACVVFNGPVPPAPAPSRCLARCDMLHPCSDPLLDCLSANAIGALGFKLPAEAPGTLVCAPRRCTAATDCPGGQCVSLGGAAFCQR